MVKEDKDIMENGKGNAIFLGIVSIATLIVAIIGATFAYFSATTESAPNAVELGAYEFKMNLNISQTISYLISSNFIVLIF